MTNSPLANQPPKLTTALACRVAGLDRDRFNEAVASGVFHCAPSTVAGRTRTFTPEDMVALYLYRELLEDGYRKDRAGRVACAVSDCARNNSDARRITFVESYFGPNSADAFPAESVPSADSWDNTQMSGTDIRTATTFNVGKMRELIAHYTAEEISVYGPEN